ncbi:kinase-like protein [Rhizoclosmatium globosum]|uniref:mitogen-activated protein kinase kinase n=1 Tax=Rhizoclosmatium globosum TaxID=329046 RepID=A0A1Y2CEN2_9FUNG|nr:kinase-like protein [Rhizoclosmatium globosum]|eukprot:ORY45511.1 kinase-like protein [Rhizoclosmatium globosum]
MPPKKPGLGLSIAPGSASAGSGVIADTTDPSDLLPHDGEDAMKLKDKDLEFLGELGAGNGGTVSKVRHIPTGIIMARKNIMVSAERQLKSELKILHIVRSDYIVSSYGAFSHEGAISVCLEYMDLGSLDNIYHKKGPIPEVTTVKIAVHVLRGLLYLSEKSILHRDIKPSNILVNSKGQVKITDFGVSKQVLDTIARTFTGTQGYLAPERITSENSYSVTSDVWALGLSLIEISTGKNVYPLLSLFEMMTYVQESEPPSLPPGKFTPMFEDLVSKCVIKDPTKRFSPEDLLRHPYCMDVIADGISLIEWAESLKD